MATDAAVDVYRHDGVDRARGLADGTALPRLPLMPSLEDGSRYCCRSSPPSPPPSAPMAASIIVPPLLNSGISPYCYCPPAHPSFTSCLPGLVVMSPRRAATSCPLESHHRLLTRRPLVPHATTSCPQMPDDSDSCRATSSRPPAHQPLILPPPLFTSRLSRVGRGEKLSLGGGKLAKVWVGCFSTGYYSLNPT
jgi:hypothetical protein